MSYARSDQKTSSKKGSAFFLGSPSDPSTGATTPTHDYTEPGTVSPGTWGQAPRSLQRTDKYGDLSRDPDDRKSYSKPTRTPQLSRPPSKGGKPSRSATYPSVRDDRQKWSPSKLYTGPSGAASPGGNGGYGQYGQQSYGEATYGK